MDEFAQTRGADDLFDDEIVPVPAEEQPQPEVQVEEQPVATVDTATPSPPADTPARPRGGEKRSRGRGRGRGGRGGPQNPGQRRPDATSRAKSVDSAAQNESETAEESARDTPDVAEQEDKSETAADKSAAGAEGPRVPAVRGDRSATGGIKKPKLTEEELSRRIAAARENAAKVAAAHARAEADQASFLEREKVAAAKRREELQHRRVMDSERERNRQRKLQAQTGREWDADKQDEAFSARGGKQFRRGMHGGVSGYTRRDFGDSAGDEASNSYSHHDSPRGRGRGRGGRGRGGARGPRDGPASEGTSRGLAESMHAPPPVIDNEAEFPALPVGEKKEDSVVEPPSDADLRRVEASLSPVSATGATWADQVESG